MSLSTWLRKLVVGSPRHTIRRQSRKDGIRSKVDLLLELLESRLVPASPVNTWLGTDAYPTFNQGLIGNYWQGQNGGSGGTGTFTETQTGMVLKASGAASWIGSPTYAPAGVNHQGPILMNGVLNFSNIAANSFTDVLGNAYVPVGTFVPNPSDGGSIDNVAARWTGYIFIPGNGITNTNGTNPIAFRIGSDDGSALYIDGGTSGVSGTNFTAPGTGIQPQINNSTYQGVVFKSVTLNLTPGLHAIDVEYYNGGGGAAFYFNWDPLGGAAWANVPNNDFSTVASSIPPAGGNPADPVGGFSNNWSDPHNWSLGRAPVNGDTVVFDTNATGFNPNNYSGTGSQLLASDFVSLLNASGNLTLAYNGAQAPSDLVTFNPATGLASFTYNTAPSTSDAVVFTSATGTTAFTYNGAASASDLLSFTQIQGSTAISYNGSASADDEVTFTQASGTVQMSYNGTNAPTTFAFTSTTSPAQFQTYLATIPALSGAGAVLVSGNSGGPFNVHFVGVAGNTGTQLAVASGPAAVTQAFFYSPTTTTAQMTTYLASIPGLTGANAPVLNGNTGGPFNINFPSGVAGGTLLVATGQAGVTQAFLNTPNTTAINLQTYLASIPGLTAAGAVTVNSTLPQDYNVNFAPGIAGGALLVAGSGGNGAVNVGAFYNTPSTTGASFQAYLAGIPALNPVGNVPSVGVNTYVGGNGGPYTVTYGTGIAGDPNLAVVAATGATIAAAPALAYSATTTPAQFAAYLASLPGLTAPGAVTVTGTTGGPFYVAYGAGVTGGTLLTAVNAGAASITQQLPTGTAGASQWNPINDMTGLVLNGIVINNSGAVTSPWFLSGNAVSINNTDNSKTNGITNTTVSYPTNNGLVPPGNPPIATVITLGQNAVVSGPIALNSTATITDDGPAPTSATLGQASLIINSSFNLNGNTLVSGPSAATIAAQTTTDSGLTVIGGTIENADLVTFAAPGTVTFSYLGQQAATPGFAYTANTTSTQFAQYLATLPGLTTLPAANVVGNVGGPFTVNLGANTPIGAALAVVGSGATVGFTAMSGNAVVEAGYGILDLSASNSYDGQTSVTSGLLVDGAVNGLGSTLSAAKTVSNTNLFPITGFGSPGAVLGVAALGDTATYNYDVLTFTGGTGTVTFSYNGLLATTPGFSFTAGTTAASALQTYLATLPGLSASTVSVTGANGGPYNVVFGSGVVGGTVLKVAAGPAVTITPFNTGVSISGAGISTPALFAGAIVSADGSANTFAAPITLSGPATLASNAGSLTLTGPMSLGTNALTLANTNGLTLNGAINSTGNASITKNGAGTATLGHDNSAFGTGGISGSTTGLIAGGGITVNTGILANTANQTLGAITDTLTFPSAGSYTLGYNGFSAPDVVTFAASASGTVNFAYNGSAASPFAYTTGSSGTSAATFQAFLSTLPGLTAPGAVLVSGSAGGPFTVTFAYGVAGGSLLAATAGTTTATVGQFAYTAATTAAQLQAYLVTIPGLSGLGANNVVGVAGGPYTIYGAMITAVNGSGTATSVAANTPNAVTVVTGASLGFNGANYLAQQPVSISGAGVVNGSTTDGSIVGTGGTAYFGGALVNTPGSDVYLGQTSGTLTLGNNGAPINLTANNLFLVGTGGLLVLNVPIVGNVAGSVGAAGVDPGSDNIIKNGASSARLTQSSPLFLGTNTINAGVLQAAADKAFGDGVHSTVTANLGGGVGLFSATALNYATTQALTLIGSGAGGGALDNIGGNNTFNGVLSFTGATSIGSDAGTMVLSQNISENNPLSFIGAGNTVVTGVISTSGSTVSPGLTESQSSLESDFGSSVGNISGTDQVLWPVMGTTTASVPGTYGYYPVGQHIWSNSDTWIYQGLINVPNLTNDVITYTGGTNPGSITLAYNGQAGSSYSYDPSATGTNTAANFLAYIQTLPGIPTAANQAGNTSGGVNVTGNTGGPFTVVFPSGTAAANLLTVSTGSAHITTTATGKGYLSFAKSIDDDAQIEVDGVVVLHSNSCASSLGSGELTLTAGFHAIDIRVSNGGGGAGANGSNSNGWTGFTTGPTPNNTIPNGTTVPYGNGIVYRVDQGPNDQAGIFVGTRTGVGSDFPNGTPGIGTSTAGGPGTGDAADDYTVPVDNGSGSLFDVPVTITKAGAGSLTLTAANTYTVPTVINAGTLIAANNNALGTNVALPGAFAVTVNAGGGLGLQSQQDILTFSASGSLTMAYAGAQASPNSFAYTAATTQAQLQTYLSTLPGLTAAGAVTVAGSAGGPFTVSFGPGIVGGSQLTVAGAGGSGAVITSPTLTLPANKNISIAGTGVSGKGAIENIAGNNIVSGAIALPNLISGPAAIGSDANLLTLLGNITQSSSLSFTGAGNVAVNGTFSGLGVTPGLLESQASGNIYIATQTAANLTGYGFDATLYPIMGEVSSSTPGTYGFYPTGNHIWTNNGTFLYQGFINVPNLTSVVFPQFTNSTAANMTLGYNGQLAPTPAFSYTSQTTPAAFLNYLNTLPTFPTNAVTVTGPNFAPASNGGPFYVNFANGTGAAQLLSAVAGGISQASLSYNPTGLGYYSFAKSIDDSAWIAVDGAVVLTSTGCATSLGSGELTLTAGWHNIDIRVANGTGGAGADGSNTNGWSGFVSGGSAGLNTGGGNGLIYRIDQGPNDTLGNTTNSGNAANYTVPTDNGTGNLFTFADTSLIMSGTGTVTLNNANSVGNDAITVNSGTLLATASGTLGSSTTNPLPITVLGGTLALSGGNVIPVNQPLSITGTGASGGALTVTSGSVTINATTTLLGNGATVYTAPTTTLNLVGQLFGSSGATLTSTSTFGSTTGTGTTILANATNAYQGATTITGGNLLQVSADGDLGTNLGSVVTINSATLDLNPAASYSTTHSYVIGTTGSTIEVDGSANTVTINSAISGVPQAAPTGALTKTGTGVLALGGVNSYGATNVNTGIVQVLNPSALGTGSNAGKVTLNGGQLSMLDASAAQGTIALTSNSFNQDTIWGGSELANLPSAGTTTGLDSATGNVLYQAGAVFAPAGTGLPANGLVTSSFNPLVNFQLQPYATPTGVGTVNNTVLLTGTGANRTMTFVTPVSLQTLNLLAISTNGTTSYKMAVNFTDNTSDTTNFVTTNGSAFTIADWFASNNNFALQGLGRIDRTGGATYLTGSQALADPRLFETDFNLATVTTGGVLDSSKTVASVTFTITSTTATNTELGIYALSGQVTPTSTPVLTNAVSVASSSTIDVENSAVTLGPLSISTGQTLTVTSAQGKTLTMGATTLPATSTINVASGQTLNLGAATDGGTAATLNLTGAGTTNFAAAATSLVNGGVINVSGGGTLNESNATGLGTLETVNLPAGTFLGTAASGLGASGTVGALNGAGTVTLGANTLTIGSTNNLASVFTGTIQDGVGTAANDGVTTGGTGITDFGTGSTLSYKGPTTVSKGTLLVDSALPNSAVTVASGGTLGGSGTISKAITANGGVAPGDPSLTTVGTLTANGQTTFSSSGIFDEVLAGNTVGATNANSKLVVGATGGLSLGGSNLTINDLASYVANPGDVYSIITLAPGASYDGTTFATFTNNGTTLPIAGGAVISTNPVTHIQTKYTLSYPAVGTTGGNITLAFAGTSGVATHLQVTVSANTTPAGSPISVTVSALDANNLFAAGYTGTIHWTSTDTAALGAGLLPPTYTFVSGDNSIHTFNNVIFITAGPQTITATDTVTPTITGTSPTVTVTPLAQTAHFIITPSSFTSSPGLPKTFAVTATDIFGNQTSGYTGTIQLSSTDTAATFQGAGIVNTAGIYTYTFTPTDAGVHVFTNGITFNTLGGQTIGAHDTVSLGSTGASGVINVTALAQKIALTPFSLTTVAGSALAITAQAQDINGNFASGYSGTATITVSGGNATFPATVTFVNGTAAFNVTFHTVAGGPFTITATDAVNSIGGTSAPITVTPSTATVFTVTPAAGTQTTGTPFNVTVTALDLYNNVATSYAGTMKLTSTDPNALTLVPSYTFTTGTGNDNGVHVFSVTLKTGGTQFITATDLNSTNPTITGTSPGITTRGLIVTSFTPTATGFTAAFNKAFLPNDLFLYNSNNTTVADVTLTGGPATFGDHQPVGKINGTLLIDPTNSIITFKATASNLIQKNQLRTGDPSYISQVLPDATYTATLVSGSGSNGFLDSVLLGLDGANNGGHANFVTTFATHFQTNNTPALGLPDFARGPDNSSGGNTVNGGVSTIEIPNQQASGIPITLYNRANVTDVFFTVTYNPSLLAHVGAYGGAGSDATDQNANLQLVSNVGGVATFHYTDTTAISATPDSPLVLGDITAIVPSSGTPNALALYQVKEQLQLGGTGASFSVNGVTNANWVVSNAVHVNAYFGDVDGDKVIDGLDKLAANSVATGAATGFSAFTQLDPVIIGDVAGDLSVDSGDVSTLDAFVAQLAPTQIPVPPTQLPSGNANFVNKTSITSPNAADPTLSLPSDMQASDGIVTVPVLLDHPHPDGSTGLTEAGLSLTYDPTVLSVTPADITLGSILNKGTGWEISTTVDATTGQIGIMLYSTTPISSTQAGSLVNIAFRVLPGASVSATSVQLVASANPNGQRFDTVLLDSQGGLILSQGRDSLTVTTGMDIVASTITTDTNGSASRQIALDVPAGVDQATGSSSLLVGTETGEGAAYALLSNGTGAGETATVHAIPVNLAVTGALAFQPNLVAVAATQVAGQVMQVGNTAWINNLVNGTTQQLTDRLAQPLARRADAPVDLAQLSQSLTSLIWDVAQPVDLSVAPAQAYTVETPTESSNGVADQATADVTVVDRLFADLASDDFSDFGDY